MGKCSDNQPTGSTTELRVVETERDCPKSFVKRPHRDDRQSFAQTLYFGPNCARSVLFCSSAVLDPTVGHTMDVLSQFISVLCHSD